MSIWAFRYNFLFNRDLQGYAQMLMSISIFQDRISLVSRKNLTKTKKTLLKALEFNSIRYLLLKTP